jgi:hypothetical protein
MSLATTLTALLCVFGMCFGANAQAAESKPFACNLKAIRAAERPRYNELVKRLRAAIRTRAELSTGYEFTLDSKRITLPEAAEWISLERLCCPFLTLRLAATGNQEHWFLTLTGPEGVKALLDSEFPSR